MSPTVDIPGGWFWMGSEGRRASESPRHRVYTRPFELAKTTVTRSDYAKFLVETNHTLPRGWLDEVFSQASQPVVGVSWFDATAYCRWLSKRTGAEWRLPTEAEWEKAAKGGDDDAEYAQAESHAGLLADNGDWPAPRRVAEGPPNAYGLFNMGDNVHEWCQDWYAPDYYPVSPERDPSGPPSGTRRASRGGSWRHAVKASRCAHRSSLPPDYRYTDYGFRLVRAPRD